MPIITNKIKEDRGHTGLEQESNKKLRMDIQNNTTTTTTEAVITPTTTTATTTTNTDSTTSESEGIVLSTAPVHPFRLLPSYLHPFVEHSHGDFFVSLCFDPHLIAQLMCEGFLPIATSRYLLPKLHKERSVIYPLCTFSSSTNKYVCNVHTSKSTKKKCKKFLVSVNLDFDGVIKGCHQQHGISWLYPQIVQAFRSMHNRTVHEPQNGYVARLIDEVTPTESTTSSSSSEEEEENNNENFRLVGTCKVKLYSVEVWNATTGKLVAGELGYTVGSIYTSLTGFTSEDSAGSVQLAALGKLLCCSGFQMWDLGMTLDYKSNLGAQTMDRMVFVEKVKEMRTNDNVDLLCEGKRNCQEVMEMEI